MTSTTIAAAFWAAIPARALTERSAKAHLVVLGSASVATITSHAMAVLWPAQDAPTQVNVLLAVLVGYTVCMACVASLIWAHLMDMAYFLKDAPDHDIDYAPAGHTVQPEEPEHTPYLQLVESHSEVEHHLTMHEVSHRIEHARALISEAIDALGGEGHVVRMLTTAHVDLSIAAATLQNSMETVPGIAHEAPMEG